ncbi:MAG: outer membrane beta-barrel protein [Vicingaceae bacterium]
MKIKQLRPLLLIFVVIASIKIAWAQQEVTTFGLQFKPILSSDLINTGPQTLREGQIEFTIEPTTGYAFGMVIRKGLNNQFSLETGINYTQRNYKLSITEDSTAFRGESDFRYVIYEIPILALVYIQLGQNTYMNTAFGASFNFLPSDWESLGDYYQHFSQRKSWVQPSLLANVGFEYRTYDKGYWYLGLSFHRPFSNITTAGVAFVTDDLNRLEKEAAFFDIRGNYLTLDLRYFFHEKPDYQQRR